MNDFEKILEGMEIGEELKLFIARGGKSWVNKTTEELEYLRWFYQHTDFGPAHEDVVSIMNERYVKLTGNKIPEGYEDE